MDYNENSDLLNRVVPLIENGAFLTVSSKEKSNTMAIGWAMTGICWRKPIVMVAVRNSRFTYSIIEEASDFTISIPSGNLRDEIFYCGTKSGRDVDKMKECGLSFAAARKTESPVIQTPGLHTECKIVYKSPMNPDVLVSEYHSLYPESDFHTLYYGEVLACYEIG